MRYELPDHLWLPQRRGIEQTISLLEDGHSVCLYGPTGSGKTEQAIQLFHWCLSRGKKGSFYLNRKLLIAQTMNRFKEAMLPFGVRAADYEDQYDHTAPFQICSADTEKSRVYDRKIWNLHPADLIVIDEAHIQKTAVMKKITTDMKEFGCQLVLLTATPIGLSSWADKLVISGTMKEYRECKALVPCVFRSIEQPDMSKVERNATGEYVIDGERRRIYTQTIVGNVISKWKEYNPDARPTMMYAPGKPESVWLTEQFVKAGVNWCHVDATECVIDGKRATLTRGRWQEILERYKDGSIRGLSSRFKLREGIDVPFTYHCILATPIGSLASFIQTVGRVLRYSSETPDNVLCTDHGGNYLRHGSPNYDRPWEQWWDLPEHAISEFHVNEIRDRKEPEPIRCPRCEGERTRGHVCPHCGLESPKSQRNVIMADGEMVVKDGHLIKTRFTKMKNDTAELWSDLYHSHLNSRNPKAKHKTFNGLAGFFVQLYHYHPPRDLPFMPTTTADWCRSISSVPKDRLITKGAA
jgi:superfamily II DNA or RNA helicase